MDISKQELPPLTFMYIEINCPMSDIPTQLGQALPRVMQHAMGNGVELAGPPRVHYMDMSAGSVTMRAGMAVGSGAVGEAEIQVEDLPAATAWVAVHEGAYDSLGSTHHAIEKQLADAGQKPAGPPREIYLTDPGQVPNPADWRTQVAWPVGE